MRSIGKGGPGPPLLGALFVAALVLAAPGALRAQAGPSGKPPPPPPGNCNVNQLVTAIQKANKTAASDTISLTAGCTYTLTAGAFDNGAGPNGLPIVIAPLVIHGNGATIVRGSNAPVFRFFQAQAALAIDHVTLKNGSTPAVDDTQVGAGGAILAVDPAPPGAPLTVTDSTLTGNTARVIGGAIYAGRVVLERDTFTANSVTLPMQGDRSVGGGAVSAGQDVQIRDSSFTGNSTASSYGGALALGGGTIAIERSTFTANTTAPSVGGAVGNAVWFQNGDDVRVADSTFTMNAGTGCAVNWEGGGPTESGNLTLTGSTFDRNLNGGLCVFAGPDVVVVVANSTFVSNRISLGGEDGWSPELHLTNVTLWQGAVWNSGQPTWQGTVTLTNSIVAGGNCQGTITDGGGNVKWSTFDDSCPGTSGDPKLLPLASNGGPTQTMALDIGSAAIGAADPGVCQAPVSSFGAGGVDQRGSSRFYPCDAGAYESP